jgi:cation transport regulator ChaB
VLTPEQRKILNAYIIDLRKTKNISRDTDFDITPLRNEATCLQVAAETGLKLSRVKIYYQTLEYRFSMKKEKMRKQQIQNELTNKISFNAVNRNPGLRRKQRFHTTIAKLQEVNIEANSSAQESTNFRKPWTKDEDRLLLLGRVVGMAYSIRGVFPLKKVLAVLPDRPTQSMFRSRYKKIVDLPESIRLTEIASAVWPIVLREKIQEDGLAEDFLTYENLEFHVKEMTERLSKRIEQELLMTTQEDYDLNRLQRTSGEVEVHHKYNLTTIKSEYEVTPAVIEVDLVTRVDLAENPSVLSSILNSEIPYCESETVSSVVPEVTTQ